MEHALGVAAVSIDGGPENRVSQFASELTTRPNILDLIYSSPVLENKDHILKVRVTGFTVGWPEFEWFIQVDNVAVHTDGSAEKPTFTPSSHPEVNLAAAKVEAENWKIQSGMLYETQIAASNNKDITWIHDGDYSAYAIDFGSGVSKFTANIAAPNATGGTIQVRLDSAGGLLIVLIIIKR